MDGPQITIGSASAHANVPDRARRDNAQRHLSVTVHHDGSGGLSIYSRRADKTADLARRLADVHLGPDDLAAISTVIRAHVPDPVLAACVAALDRVLARMEDREVTGFSVDDYEAVRDAVAAARATKGA